MAEAKIKKILNPEKRRNFSMDGRDRCLDNAKMERFWWALKYENIKLL